MNKLNRFLILIPGIVWGVSFISVEIVLPVIPPITLTLGRGVISVIMLTAMMYYAGGYFPRTLKAWWPFFILGALNQALPFVIGAWAQIYIEAGLASIFLSVMPIFTVLLAAIFFDDEKLTRLKVAGVALGFLGILVIIGPSVSAESNQSGIVLVAQLTMVMASLLYALGAVYARYVYPVQPKDLSPWGLRLRIVASQFLMSSLTLLPLSLIFEQPWTIRPNGTVIFHMLFLGIGVTLLATITYFYLIEQLGAGPASMTIYLIPVAGVLAGIFFLGEQFRWEMGIGLVLILAGIAVSGR